MEKQIKKTTKYTTVLIIAIISVLLNIFFIFAFINMFNREKKNVNQTLDNNETIIESDVDTEEENKGIEIIETEQKETEVQYIYKYIEGKEKQVIVEKEVEKTIEVPASPTDAIVTYIDASGSTKIINLPSGTTISFSAGEHGTYDTLPSSITLTDNQELDITDSSYYPSKVEVNYIFKGLSYSGDTMTCMYSLVSNTVDAGCLQIVNPIKIGETVYIQFDYLESTGTQYINTNINLPNDCVMDIDIQFLNDTNLNLIGTVGGGLGRADFGALNGKWFCYMGDDFYGDTMIADNNRHLFEMNYKNKYFSIDGTSVKTFGSVKGTQKPYYLFARYDVSSISPYARCRLYRWSVSQNSAFKYDLVPAERVSDGKVGMLDRQNGTFYTNQGTGVFNHPDIALKSGVNIGKIMTSGSYENGSSLELTAVANTGYRFVKWLDNNSTSATRNITVGSNNTYTALFMQN